MKEPTMTADTQTQSVPEQASGGVGRVARVIGAIVDVEFPQDAIPEINNALKVEVSLFAYNDNFKTRSIVLFEQERQMLVESFHIVLRKHNDGNGWQFATFFLVASVALNRTEERISHYRHDGQQQNYDAYYDCYIVD